MDELHREADKLFDEIEHLERVIYDDDPAATQLALSVAKRARRSVTLVIKALAERRDNELQT